MMTYSSSVPNHLISKKSRKESKMFKDIIERIICKRLNENELCFDSFTLFIQNIIDFEVFG